MRPGRWFNRRKKTARVQHGGAEISGISEKVFRFAQFLDGRPREAPKILASPRSLRLCVEPLLSCWLTSRTSNLHGRPTDRLINDQMQGCANLARVKPRGPQRSSPRHPRPATPPGANALYRLNFVAIRAASVRFFAFSALKTAARWILTVPMPRSRPRAICLVGCPCPSSRNTSACRLVNRGGGDRPWPPPVGVGNWIVS